MLSKSGMAAIAADTWASHSSGSATHRSNSDGRMAPVHDGARSGGPHWAPEVLDVIHRLTTGSSGVGPFVTHASRPSGAKLKDVWRVVESRSGCNGPNSDSPWGTAGVA